MAGKRNRVESAERLFVKTKATLDIFDLLSPVRKERLLISFCTTKFCSSRLKFWRKNSSRRQTSCSSVVSIQNVWLDTHGGQQTYMRLAPEDEYLSDHPEELIGVSVWFFQPPGPAIKEINTSAISPPNNCLKTALPSTSRGSNLLLST